MSVLGTEYKINIHVEPIDGYHMSDYDFEAQLYVYSSRSVTIRKEEMKKVDDDNYIVVVDSVKALKIGKGTVKLKLIAHISDGDFPDGYRTEIAEVCTGVTVV